MQGMVEASKTLEPSLSELQGGTVGGQPGAGQGLSSQPDQPDQSRGPSSSVPQHSSSNGRGGQHPAVGGHHGLGGHDRGLSSVGVVWVATVQGVPWSWRRTTSWAFSSWRREDWVEAFRVEDRVEAFLGVV